IAGIRKVSPAERWLLAISTGPSAGMFSSPSIHGRNSARTNGPTTHHLSTQYSNRPPPSQVHATNGGANSIVGLYRRAHESSDGPAEPPGEGRCGAVPRRCRGGGGAALSRLHRLTGVAAGLGRGPGGPRLHGRPAAAARARHPLAGPERDRVDRLVRPGRPGVPPARRRAPG